MSKPIPFKQDHLAWIEDWFTRQCDGDWEHEYGIKVETSDNPGWIVEIDYVGTYLEGRNFLTVDIERSENDWLKCRIESGKFKGSGGPRNLAEVLITFRHWAETQT
ncbi:immunity 53 family protein [Parvularcula maris]|uniref:Immunity 53 family protein n=1 Tax=Parvularcula maris TaxID=2965077 RepID=A0A9X2L8E5_9PROT|nr:immunity 53 family protein [Parvularcula maris]MCQ8184871.1 immunity 53 family protein [Parvularcula maris]